MVTVSNERTTLSVTQGAFKNFYSQCGFRIVGGAKNPDIFRGVNVSPEDISAHPSDSTQPEIDAADSYEGDSYEEDSDEVDFSEVPLSELSFGQLCSYAEQLGLDYSNVRYKKELRALIREHLK